jgi:uncharacterized membrane protein YeaQ/YmgE (transglycosylase-associated protein family)
MNEVVLASGIGTGRTSVGFIAYIIIGGFAGWAASKFMGTAAQQGIILNIVVGVAGAIIGGFVLRLFDVDVSGGGWFFTFFMALLGAVILLALFKLITGRK